MNLIPNNKESGGIGGSLFSGVLAVARICWVRCEAEGRDGKAR